jgi:ParB-like chromosome segregation protein Spo0J
MKTDNTKNTLEDITMDELDGFIEMDTKEVHVPKGRFRPLDPKAVESLKESIEKHKQLQPIIVSKAGDLIDGNHRLHACKELGIKVIANIIDEVNEDQLKLIEIDTNLIRKELSATETENHLAERKRLYNLLYPDTAKRGAKSTDASGKKNFSASTAELTGSSEKTVERAVKRGSEASPELQQARDDKKISTSDIDNIIKDVGSDTEKQHEAMKNLIKKKAESKAEADKKKLDKAKKEENIPEDVSTIADEFQDENIELHAELQKVRDELFSVAQELEKVKKELNKKKTSLTKANKSVENLQQRIEKAKTANPELKI